MLAIASLAAVRVLATEVKPRPLRVWGTNVQSPILLKRVEPDYPAISPRAHPATALLRLWLDGKGNVVDVEVLKPAGFDVLTDAVVAAVRKWKYVPAKVGGVRVGSVVEVVIPAGGSEAPPN